MPQPEVREPSAEERLVAILFRHPEAAPEVALRSERVWIESSIVELCYDITCTYACDHGVAPTREILLELMARRSPETEAVHAQALARIDAVPVSLNEEKHISFFCENLERDFKGRIAEKAMYAAAALLGKKDVDGALEALQSGTSTTLTKFSRAELASDFGTFWSEYERRKADPKLRRGVQTGFRVFDEATGGHFRKELGVMVAGQGVGKSLFLGQVAVNAARGGNRVLLITVENNRDTYMRRLYSNIAEVDYHDLKLAQLTPEAESKLFEAVASLPRDFTLEVVHLNPPCSARDIMNIMRANQKAFDYLIVDQITNMFPIHPRDFKTMDWRWYSQIALELRVLGDVVYDSRGIGVLTAVHAAGGTTDKKELSGDDTALSKSIGYHADFMLWFTRPDNEFTIGRSKLRDASFEPFTVYPEWRYWQLRGDDVGNPNHQAIAAQNAATDFDVAELERQDAAARARDLAIVKTGLVIPPEFVPEAIPAAPPAPVADAITGLSSEDI